MGMVVRTNMAGLNANNALNMASKTQQNAMQKLASGFRINKAADDASGLAISEKMKNQIKALDTAADNCEDGANMIQTAEGYMGEVHDMLNRMTELAEKAANGVLDDTDRDALQDEMDQLCSEIDRVATTANFNGHKLMDGSLGSSAQVKITGQNAGEKMGFEGPAGATLADKLSTFGGATVVGGFTFTGGRSSATLQCVTATGTGSATGVSITAKEVLADGSLGASAVTLSMAVKEGDTVTIATGGTGTTSNGLTVSGATTHVGATLTFKGGKWVQQDGGDAAGLTITGVDGQNGDKFTIHDVDPNAKAGIKLQIGESSTTADKLDISINSFHTDSLFGGLNGVKNKENDLTNDASVAGVKIENANAASTYTDAVTINIKDKDSASAAADAIRQISNYVSDERGKLGAQQNRLEHTINNLTTSAENVTAANSRIRDTNMAEEMMDYTSKNVIAQAAQAMLAQANSQPQNVLSLLQ